MEHRLYNVDCHKIYIWSVSTCKDSSWELPLPTGPKVPPKHSCSSDILFHTISIWFFAFACYSWSAPFRRSYFVLAETRQITIRIILHMSLSMLGFNWVTFLGIPSITFICSDADLLEFCMVWPWLWTKSVSGTLRSSITLRRAEHIYGYPIQALEIKLAWMYPPFPQTYHCLTWRILPAL